MNIIKPETTAEQIARLELANAHLTKANDDLTKLTLAATKLLHEYEALLRRSMAQTDQLITSKEERNARL